VLAIRGKRAFVGAATARGVAAGMRLDGGCGCAGSSVMTLVCNAARQGDLAEVQRLVGQYPRGLNACINKWTPLMQASAPGHFEVVRWLVDRGADLDQRHETGQTALYEASEKGQTAVVRLLLRGGPTPPSRAMTKANGRLP
jgi:ankyrin repeat protein